MTIDMPQTYRCFLLELPTELRVRIYEFVYDTDIRSMIVVADNERYSWQDPPEEYSAIPQQTTALLKTCKVINHEATTALYEATRFDFHLTMRPDESSRNSDNYDFLDRGIRIREFAVCQDTYEEPLEVETLIGRIRSLVSRLPDRVIAIERFCMLLEHKFVSSDEADPIAMALTSVRCVPGSEFEVIASPCISASTQERVEKALGVRMKYSPG